MRAPYERFQDVWDHPVASHMRLAPCGSASSEEGCVVLDPPASEFVCYNFLAV